MSLQDLLYYWHTILSRVSGNAIFFLRCGFNELFIAKNVNIKYLPGTYFFPFKGSELWTALTISCSFPGELTNWKRRQMREPSVDGFLTPNNPEKHGLCHKAQCSYWTLRKINVFQACGALPAPSYDIKKRTAEGMKWGLENWRYDYIMHSCCSFKLTYLHSEIPQDTWPSAEIPRWILQVTELCSQTSRHLIKTHPGMSTPAVVTPPDRGIPVKQYLNVINGTKAPDTSVQARCR